MRDEAWCISWGLRSLFGRPEIVSFVRAAEEELVPYWRRMLPHSPGGNLQAGVDEYLHVLTESEGLQETHWAKRARARALAGLVVETASTQSRTRWARWCWRGSVVAWSVAGVFAGQ